MKKVLLLVMSLLVLFGASVSAEENIFATAYKNGDWLYTQSGEILAFAGTGDTAVIPENSVVSSDFKFTESGILSEHEEIPIKKLIVSKNVKFKGSLSMARYKGFTDVEFYNTMDDMPKISVRLTDNMQLKTLKLPDGLTEIPAKMCSGCTALDNVSLPDSLKTINQNSFEKCTSLKTINLTDSIETIGENAFRGCEQLKEIKLPSSLRQLGKDAFSKSGITKVTVPAGVDYSCIPNETAIADIKFEAEPKRTADFYHYFWNTEWLNEKVFPSIKDEFLICDGQLVKYLGNNDKAVIPDGVKIIGKNAFNSNSKLKNVVIPNSVKEIGEAAFYKCSALEALELPKSVEMVGDSAFAFCSNISSLTIEGNTVFDDVVFYECLGLRDENINVTGKILYKTSKIENDPFQFTKTSYAVEPYYEHTSIDHTPMPTEAPKTTNSPKETAEPKTTNEPKETTEPKPTPNPTAMPIETNVPRELEVKGGEEIEISVDGKAVSFDAKPFIDENNRTQVPIRAVAEMLNAKVDWSGETQTVTISKDEKIIKTVIGSDAIIVDGKAVKMDTAAIIKDNRTYIPVRFVAEALGLTVEWK